LEIDSKLSAQRVCTVTAKNDSGPFQELRQSTKTLQVLLSKRRAFDRGTEDACLVQHARQAVAISDLEFEEQADI